MSISELYPSSTTPSTTLPTPDFSRTASDASMLPSPKSHTIATGASELQSEIAEPTLTKRDSLIKEIGCHSTLIIAGWSDASSGPLIPYIQAYFSVSYTVVSMLFVGQMVGFLIAGAANGHLSQKFGLGRVITAGAVIQMLGYIFLVPAFAFPVMPICYAIIGFGMALQDAQANTFVAILPNAEQKFGYLHASYGVGALLCPLAATAFASSGRKFSHFYTISIALSTINVAVLLYAFRFSYRVPPEPTPAIELKDVQGGETAKVEHQKAKRGAMAETFMSRNMWLFSIFILVYVGAEVSMGGWIVTFVIDERHGSPSAGYVATGFWAGIALGRAVLPRLNVLVGERAVVFIYLGLAIGLEFAIWFADSLIGNAVTVAIVGFALGPLYPNTMSVATKVLPRRLHAVSIGFIAAFGQTGSAIFPFVTGALAQKFSTTALQPVMIALLVAMAAVWVWVPPIAQKKE